MAENDYNSELCKEKHNTIDNDIIVVHKRINGLEARFWGIIILLVANLSGIIGVILTIKSKTIL